MSVLAQWFTALTVLCSQSVANALVFRPPAAPLIVTSPFISIWSAADELTGANTTHWSGAASNLAGMVVVDGSPWCWMGNAVTLGLPAVTQLGYARVAATQTYYSFAIGTSVALNVTFTTPLVLPPTLDVINASSPDFFTLPVSYISWSAASLDGAAHAVAVYADIDATVVTNNSFATTTPVSWARVMNGSAARLGATQQWPLNPIVCGQSVPLTGSQTIVWGWLYAMCDACSGSYAGPTWTARAAFQSSGAVPSSDAPSPVNGTAVGDGFPGLAYVWSVTVAASGAAQTGFVTLFMDEILSHNYSFDGLSPAVIMTPFWRRNLPFNDTEGVPDEALTTAHSQYAEARAACDAWDAQLAADVHAATMGAPGAANATEGADAHTMLASLVYRQVIGHHALSWNAQEGRLWYFLKEIASGGDDSTMDVIFPSFPLLMSYSPDLLAHLLLPLMNASAADAYRKAWFVHDLGKFPIANRNWGGQEDMPLEETGNMMLLVAGIGYLNGSNLELFRPFYEMATGFPRWGAFLASELPYPPRQGTTDDFMGSTANGTNLVIKGCAALAAWGYVQWVFGNTTGATEAWMAAGACGAALVVNGWYSPPTSDAVDGSHFTWSYQLQPYAGSFICTYNLFPIPLLRMCNLLPNQTSIMQQQAAFFALDGTGVGQQFGVPLINGSAGMKLDWNTFLATALYDSPAPLPSGACNLTQAPVASTFSSSVFVGMLAGANVTNLRAPLTDYFLATDATYGGKYRGRPVMGAAFAGVALAKLAALPELDHEAAMAAAIAAGQQAALARLR